MIKYVEAVVQRVELYWRWFIPFVASKLRWFWGSIPAYKAFYLFVMIALYAGLKGRQQATVISAFQLPPKSEGQPFPFSGETVANVLRDAIYSIQQEGEARTPSLRCSSSTDEDVMVVLSGINPAPMSTSYELVSPVTVEVKGLSVEGLVSQAREVLRRERRISGDVVLDGRDSFQLMARANDDPGSWSVNSEEISLNGLKKASCGLAERVLAVTERNVLASALIRRGKYNDVIALYGPHGGEHDPVALNRLGVALRMLSRTDEAVAKFHQALAIKRCSPDAHTNLALALGDKEQYDEAIAESTKAIKLKPDSYEAHDSLGYALSMKRQWNDAIIEYRKAVELDSDVALSHVFLATALGVAGHHDEANLELKKAIELKPNSAEVRTGVGTALQYAGRSQEAIAAFKQAIELKPNLLRAHTELGAVLIVTHQWDEAIIECRKTLEIKPESPEAHRCLANALMGKDPDLMFSAARGEVTTELRKAIELKPDFAEAHMDLGNVLLFSTLPNRNEEGVSELRKAVELKPGYAEAHNSLGFALNETGRWDEAISEFRKAIELRPDYPEAQSNLAKAEALSRHPVRP